jgi:hypothetical protein
VGKAEGQIRRARRLLVISALAVILTSVAASVSNAQTSAAAGPPCNSSFNPYHYTEAQVRACGYTTFPMMAAPDLAGGGSVVEYNVHGRLVQNLIPPSGFRPESASAAQLDEYGFPPRPTDPTLLARWQDEMSGWKGAAPPTPFLAETHTQVTADTVNHPIWAGYAVTAEPGSISAFSHVEGWYYEPTFGSSRCTSTTEVTWAGLGGYYNPYNGGWLAQDGTAWNSNGADAHEAWWEIVPANNLTPINYYATPGVIMDVSVRVISGGFRFWFYNYAGTSMAFDEPFTSASNSLSAEVVVERPTVGHTPTNLANFQTLRVWQSEAWINGFANGNTFDTFPANLNSATGLWRHGLHMVSDTTGRVLADPSDIFSSGAFDVMQRNCN